MKSGGVITLKKLQGDMGTAEEKEVQLSFFVSLINSPKMSFRLLLLLNFFIGLNAGAQIVYSIFPKALQMFVREADGYGRFRVEGTAPANTILKSEVSAMNDHRVAESFTFQVTSTGKFTFDHKIRSELREYVLRVYTLSSGGKWWLNRETGRLVAGDFYIIDGQSNAEASTSLGERIFDSTHYHSCLRTIGSNLTAAIALNRDSTGFLHEQLDDLNFKVAGSHPDVNDTVGYSGIWGLRLQYRLALQTGIPNCVVNGSKGATAITVHFPTHIPSGAISPEKKDSAVLKRPVSLYDRMYHKLYFNNVIEGVKGIFWYQGETDGNGSEDSVLNYTAKFAHLRKAWKKDYPNVKKIFVFQINLGCNDARLPQIREQQRNFSKIFSDVTVMSTVGSSPNDRNADYCHYSIQGNVRLADLLFPLVMRDIYDFPIDNSIAVAPDIVSVKFSHPLVVDLEFDRNVLVQQYAWYPYPFNGRAYLTDYFFDGDNKKLSIKEIVSKGKHVELHLANSQKIDHLTYLPACFSEIPGPYLGPWILNEANPQIGAFSFYRFKVQPFSQLTVKSEEIRPISVFPNPAKGSLSYRLEGAGENRYVVENSVGHILLTGQGKEETTINVSDLEAGFYTLKVISTKMSYLRKVVIE
jgi:hypothetical protein